jgi:hypothetical protein
VGIHDFGWICFWLVLYVLYVYPSFYNSLLALFSSFVVCRVTLLLLSHYEILFSTLCIEGCSALPSLSLSFGHGRPEYLIASQIYPNRLPLRTSPICSCPLSTWSSWVAVEGLTRPTNPRPSRSLFTACPSDIVRIGGQVHI